MANIKESGQYVSRAGSKLEFANQLFKVDFNDKLVLDVGSSTGGFSDYALQKGARRIIAIELGSRQMTTSLLSSGKIELHEKTNILAVEPYNSSNKVMKLSFVPDIVLVDLSFVSLKTILPHLANLVNKNSQLVVLVKPQFEAGANDKNHGIIKNENVRRRIFRDFESWVKKYFVVKAKVDSAIIGTKGNKERFYLLVKALNSKSRAS